MRLRFIGTNRRRLLDALDEPAVMTLKYISEQLGHASIAITVDTYGHLIPGGNRQAVDRLDGVSSGNANGDQNGDQPRSANLSL